MIGSYTNLCKNLFKFKIKNHLHFVNGPRLNIGAREGTRTPKPYGTRS